MLTNLAEITRFSKSQITQRSISNLQIVPVKKEIITIVLTQLRLDTVVSELLHASRTKANELISQERVIVNYETKTKNATMLKQGDILTVRGKGKFKIAETLEQTAKGKLRIVVEKYIS